jgi:hypothetical protein
MITALIAIGIFVAGLAVSFFIWVIGIRKDVDLNKQQLDLHLQGFSTFKIDIKKDFDDIISSNKETQKLLNEIITKITVSNNNSEHEVADRKELKSKVVELEKVVSDLKGKILSIVEGYEHIKSSPEYQHLKSHE